MEHIKKQKLIETLSSQGDDYVDVGILCRNTIFRVERAESMVSPKLRYLPIHSYVVIVFS
jgi:hypothetical protein